MVSANEWISCSYCTWHLPVSKIDPSKSQDTKTLQIVQNDAQTHHTTVQNEALYEDDLNLEAFGLANSLLIANNPSTTSRRESLPSRRKSMDIHSIRAIRMDDSQFTPEDEWRNAIKSYVHAFTGSQLSTNHEILLKEPPLDFCKYLLSISKDPQSSTEINSSKTDSLKNEKTYSGDESKDLGSEEKGGSKGSSASFVVNCNFRNREFKSTGLQEFAAARPKSILRRPSVGGIGAPSSIVFNQDFGRSSRRQSIMGTMMSTASKASDNQSSGSQLDQHLENQLSEMEKQLKERLKRRLFRKGEFIIRKDEIGTEMYFIVSGKVEVVSSNGRLRYGVIEEGAFFGNYS
jgi:hypothetical protein